MIHQLKQKSYYFEYVISGEKTFEVRVNDRGFGPGDYLALNEIDSEGNYTGRSCIVYVDYILYDLPGLLPKNVVVMSIKPCKVFQTQTSNIDWGGAPENWSNVPVVESENLK